MSLTSLLKEKNSWVNKFLETEMPDIFKYSSSVARRFKAPLVVPAQPGYSYSGQHYALAGTAFDNMVRLGHGESPWSLPMFEYGIAKIAFNYSYTDEQNRTYYPTAMSIYAAIEEADYSGGDWPLAEIALFTAYLVHEGRSSFLGPSLFKNTFPFFDVRIAHGYPSYWNDISDDLPFPLLWDLVRLYRRFTPYAKRLNMKQKGVFGPTFAGSLNVGGADADFISSDGCLLDFKVVNRPRFADDLRQALGYVLLDYQDKYNINRLSWYYARHGVFVTLPLAEVLSEVAGPGASMSNLRNKFIEVAGETVANSGADVLPSLVHNTNEGSISRSSATFHGCWTADFWSIAKAPYDQVPCKGCGRLLYLAPDDVQRLGSCRCMWPDGPTAGPLLDTSIL